jgi:hypothetical protein
MPRQTPFAVENDIEQDACDLVWKYLGIEGSKLKVLGDTGYPDRIFWLPGGRPILIEFKRPGEEPRPKQEQIHERLRGLGYEVQTHDNAIAAFQAVIDAVDTTRLSEDGRKILARARRRCAVLRSRAR